jgi:hypothetical protein
MQKQIEEGNLVRTLEKFRTLHQLNFAIRGPPFRLPDVHTYNGVVSLNEVVLTPEEKERAEEIARGVRRGRTS